MKNFFFNCIQLLFISFLMTSNIFAAVSDSRMPEAITRCKRLHTRLSVWQIYNNMYIWMPMCVYSVRAVLVWLADKLHDWLMERCGAPFLRLAVLNISCWAEGPPMVPLHPFHCLQSPGDDHFLVVNPAIKMQKTVWPWRLAGCAHKRERPTTAPTCQRSNGGPKEMQFFSINDSEKHGFHRMQTWGNTVIKPCAPAPKWCPSSFANEYVVAYFSSKILN